ncbi:uncharacterized protein [Henckelia pumila]|uniref:uncharacterized protein n=1 Tax=Henckelia pumila TaxID=405737 RepID=UPI003C6EA26B
MVQTALNQNPPPPPAPVGQPNQMDACGRSLRGLRGGEFFKSLVKNPPLTFDELLSRAKKYVNLEDAQRPRRLEGTSKSKSGSNFGMKAEGKVEEGRKKAAEAPIRAEGPYPYVPLSVSLEKAMQRLGEEVQRIIYEDPRIKAKLNKRANPPRHGQAPQWRNQMNEVMGNQPDNQKRALQNGQGDRVEKISNHPHKGMIHMISIGTTYGDLGRARKAHGLRLKNFEVNPQSNYFVVPNISFGREDLKDVALPHNYPLLVTLNIANYDVAHIFVDIGSSVNIIFKETLDQMNLEGFELYPITTELYGFTGHALKPLGQIVLPLSLGSRDHRATKMACFTVVDTPSSFNGILDCSSLSNFQAVASNYHHKLKFPISREVGVVRVDQKSARLYYLNEIKSDAKRSQREVGTGVFAW